MLQQRSLSLSTKSLAEQALFLGKFLDLPGDEFRDVEDDVGLNELQASAPTPTWATGREAS
jgi:hypothetical protein